MATDKTSSKTKTALATVRNIAPATTALDAARANLAAVRDYLLSEFSEREEVVEMLLTAAVGGEHMVMVGVPGTGKSAIARAFAECIGGSYYEYLFTAFSVPEEFVGPFSLKALDNDEYRRVLDGRFCDADVVFADEIFKSNSASLNTLLPILNERIVHNGGKPTKVPLRVCVAASNEMPQGDELGALWDRLLLRCVVEPLKSNSNRRALLKRQLAPTRSAVPHITMAELELLASDGVSGVSISDETIELFLNLRAQLEGAGIVYGDRRWVKALKLVRANAVVHGDDQADEFHMRILCSVLWSTPEQRDVVNEKVGALAAPEIQKAAALYDALVEQVKKCEGRGKVDDFGAAIHECTETHKKLKLMAEKVGADTRSGKSIERSATLVRETHERLRNELTNRFLTKGL